MPIDTIINAVKGLTGADATALTSAADTRAARITAQAKAGGAARSETFRKFEAMVLQNFVQTMLPEDNEAVYGNGIAGDVWKSFLAKEIADQMANRGGVGIASRVLADHYMEGDTKVALSGVSHDPQKPEADKQEMLSSALVQELQRNMVKSIGAEIGSNGSTGVFSDK